MRSDRERLLDIQVTIAHIEKYAAQGRDSFERDELIQVWIIHHLELIGEASRALSAALRDQHREVPWADIIAFRNVLIHEYFGIDLAEVWRIVERDLPVLKHQIAVILEELGGRA